MKIKFVKTHNEHAKGDVVEVYDDQANYLIGVGAAEKWEKPKQKEDKTERSTKEDKTDTKTK